MPVVRATAGSDWSATAARRTSPARRSAKATSGRRFSLHSHRLRHEDRRAGSGGRAPVRPRSPQIWLPVAHTAERKSVPSLYAELDLEGLLSPILIASPDDSRNEERSRRDLSTWWAGIGGTSLGSLATSTANLPPPCEGCVKKV